VGRPLGLIGIHIAAEAAPALFFASFATPGEPIIDINDTAREWHLEINAWNAGSTPVALLANASGLSHQAVKSIMHKGAVWLERSGHTRRLRRHKAALKAGDRLHLYHDPAVLSAQTAPAVLVADEGDYSVWDKPSGMLSEGSKWGDHTSITRFAEARLQRVGFLVHRLDRAASGLVLVAHGKAVTRELCSLFEQRRVHKAYAVTVYGRFPTDLPVLRQPIDGRPAVSHAQLVRYDPDHDTSQLRITIETGRKHQIRRHLAAAGFAVVGDTLYGQQNPPEEVDLQLRAVELAFEYLGQARKYRAP